MIEGKRVLALIPARGGSKGIKDKNITPLCGKPLIAYSVLAAKNSRYIDDVVVTTDSERIAEIAKAYGAEVPFLRPAELASDTAKTIDAVLHAVKWLEDHQKSYDLLAAPTDAATAKGRRYRRSDRTLYTKGYAGCCFRKRSLGASDFNEDYR